MDSNIEKMTVRALYKFKASNNDELTFKKDDLITVTQKEDGGWWEGTSHDTGKTGWFPSNYVKEIETSKPCSTEDILSNQVNARMQLIKDMIEKEREFVTEIESLQLNYLEKLNLSNRLDENSYNQLVGNIEELIEIHRCFIVALEDSAALNGNPRDQRIGRVMLNYGSNIKKAHLTYWDNHPKAVNILEKHKEDLEAFMESHGASKPGLMLLTTLLSRPLRHLEKYAGNAQELEQHLEDDHPDRGDTQRSVSFYKNVAADCAKARRQKELEFEVLTGVIRNWEGEEQISQLGDIIFMGSVAVGPEYKDRYLVLFPQTLLILSVSSRMSAFIYEGKLPLSGIAVNRLEDIETVKNSFEISGPMIDRILIICQTKQDSLKWVETLCAQIKISRQNSVSHVQLPHPPNQLPFHTGIKPHTMSPLPQKRSNTVNPTWKMSCLMPAPPTRNHLTQVAENTPGNRRSASMRKPPGKDPDTTYDDDMQILRVIESYCWSKTQRQTLQPTSTLMDNFNVLASEEDKQICDENHVNERYMAEILQSLQEQVSSLHTQNRNLVRQIDEESRARKRLESSLRNLNVIDYLENE